MKPFNKVINPVSSTFCKIKFDGKKLSISGVEGPMANGNCRGGCGQINPIIDGTLTKGWSFQSLHEFNAIWERWHLNDMIAGTPEQEAFLRMLKDGGWKYESYDVACLKLKDNDLLVVTHEGEDYKYGSKWLFEEVPADVIKFLSELPDSERKPAWV